MIIFWHGRGLLIPLFIILGVGLGVLAALFLEPVLAGSVPKITFVLPFLGAILGAYVCANTVCKSEYQRIIDPGTRRPILMVRKHTFYFVSAPVWTFIVALIGVACGLGIYMLEMNSPLRTASAETKAAVKTLDDRIEGVLEGDEDSPAAQGNTAAAQKLAEEFHTAWSASVGKTLNLRPGTEKLIMQDVGLRCYCMLTRAHCAFFIKARRTKPLGKGASDTLATTAWMEVPGAVDRTGLNILRATVIVDQMFAKGTTRELKEGLNSNEAKIDREALLVQLVEDKAFAGGGSSVAATPSSKETAKPASDTSKPEPVATAPAIPSATTDSAPTPAPAAALPTAVREWKDTTGRLLRASLTGFTTEEKDVGTFKREDGQVFQVPIARFSEADRAFIESLGNGGTPAQ